MNLQDQLDIIDSRHHEATVLTAEQIEQMPARNPDQQALIDQLSVARLSIGTTLTQPQQS